MTKEFDKRNMAKSRRVCEDMEAAHVTKWLKLTERERQILDMWPKFEDGEYVWFGDRVYELCGKVYGVCLDDDAISLRTAYIDHMPLDFGERVKRLEPEVLDADGVEINVGDTVWFRSFSTGNRMCRATVTGFGERNLDVRLATVEDEAGRTWNIDPKRITHTPPDSWERLEEDAAKDECEYFGINGLAVRSCRTCPKYDSDVCCYKAVKLDIVRRAKALAGAEVSE